MIKEYFFPTIIYIKDLPNPNELINYHRDYLDLLCLFGCLEYTEVSNAIRMYEKNNVN